MRMPELRITTESVPSDLEDAVHVVLAVEADGKDDAPGLLAADAFLPLAERLPGLGLSGRRGETLRTDLEADGARLSVLLAGAGPRPAEGRPSGELLRLTAAAAVRALPRARALSFAVPGLDAEGAAELATGALLAAYRFDEFRSEPPREGLELVSISIGPDGDAGAAEEAVARARTVCAAVWRVRNLVNTPPNALGPAELAAAAVEDAERSGLEVHVRDEEALEREGFGGHLGVGRGSARPPRLVRLEWAPQEAVAHLALVGKGITFDTGGLSLKPASAMVGMKFDMAGAAVVLGVLRAAAELRLPVRLTGWMCLAENMPSDRATRPDDVIAVHGGKTVEVTNTDAEGRLVLADGLVAACAEGPDAVVDVATLTGAQLIALGERTSGVMDNDEQWAGRVLAAAEEVGEPAWRMPIPAELEEVLSSDVADLVNAKPGNRNAGMLLAARFLREFVGGEDDAPPLPWVHIDIAGPANNEKKPYGVTPAGATGVMVRTLVRMIERLGADAG
ncbi:MAG: leucyl aminopeptidase [Pseudoclavibacter sp.]|nr:leucyl aminopeptidase [Pseudoclavibacter sp.]